MSYLNGALVAALTLAPVMGGILQTSFGVKASFWVMAFLELLGLITTVCYPQSAKMSLRLILLPLSPIFTIVLASSILSMGVGIMMPNVSTQAFSRYTASLGTVGALYGFIQMLLVSGLSFVVSLFTQNREISTGIILLTLCSASAGIYMLNHKIALTRGKW